MNTNRPESWKEHRRRIHLTPLSLFMTAEWFWEWVAWSLNNWKFVEVLERVGTFSVLVAVVFYFAESGKRTRAEHYEAWQVINTAQGKGGSGGRIEALQQLNSDRVSLIGVDASGAFLQGIQLGGALLMRSNFAAADMRESRLHRVNLSNANLSWTNLRQSDLSGAGLRDATLGNADLFGADLDGADLTGADLRNADLRFADLNHVRLDHIVSAYHANIFGVRNASVDITKTLMAAGAVSSQSDIR